MKGGSRQEPARAWTAHLPPSVGAARRRLPNRTGVQPLTHAPTQSTTQLSRAARVTALQRSGSSRGRVGGSVRVVARGREAGYKHACMHAGGGALRAHTAAGVREMCTKCRGVLQREAGAMQGVGGGKHKGGRAAAAEQRPSAVRGLAGSRGCWRWPQGRPRPTASGRCRQTPAERVAELRQVPSSMAGRAQRGWRTGGGAPEEGCQPCPPALASTPHWLGTCW